MTNYQYDIRPDRPLPAPLPYSSLAGRGEIPPAPVPDPADRESEDPDAPLLREDERTFWIVTGFVGLFIALMVLIAAVGGL